MATYTKNLQLKLPTQMDFYNVADFNENFEKIDRTLGELSPKLVTKTITLDAGSWNTSSKQYVATCEGIADNELMQVLDIRPVPSNTDAYNNAGIRVTKQRANTLTFTANTVPTTNIVVHVVILNL